MNLPKVFIVVFIFEGFTHYNWTELQKASLSDKELAEDTGMTLVDGTPLTPQQLGNNLRDLSLNLSQ